MIVAIDGPAGAGKSSVARGLAARLGIGYLDTGAMYRALTLLAARRDVDPDDGASLASLARDHPVTFLDSSAGRRVCVDGEDVTDAIRAPEISASVSVVATHRDVRAVMVSAQRRALSSGDWVVEGRDIGSNVCPGADVKIFLTASDRERARRRRGELAAWGIARDESEVLGDLRWRDRLDSEREQDPLVVPENAVVIDSTALPLDEVVATIARVVGDMTAAARE